MHRINEEGEREEWFLNPKRAHALKHAHLLPKGKSQKKADIVVDPKTGAVIVQSEEEERPLKVFNAPQGEVEAQWIGEVLHHGEELVVVRGGRGGRGNWQFRSSTHTTPMEAETGEGAEEGLFFLELESLADVGFVGFPNVGKSTLLSVLTKARPEIANYPFTTLEPNLGVLSYDAIDSSDRASYLVADIPGIIEGASEGKGLGVAFLRHIERCRALVFVISLDDYELLSHQDDPKLIAEALIEQYEKLEDELRTYEQEHKRSDDRRVPLSQKERLICISKADLLPEELRPDITSSASILKNALFISGKTLEGVDELKAKLHTILGK
jgi:GTPase